MKRKVEWCRPRRAASIPVEHARRAGTLHEVGPEAGAQHGERALNTVALAGIVLRPKRISCEIPCSRW